MYIYIYMCVCVCVYVCACVCSSTVGGGFRFRSADRSALLVMSSDGTIDPLIWPRCVVNSDSRTITNWSRQSMSRRMRSHN